MKRKGYVLVQILFISVILLSIIMLALTNHINNTRKITRMSESYNLRAYEVAKAGAIDCLNFFRRQTTQPVTSFNPTINDSENPAIGIQRTLDIFGMTDNIKGRYIIDRGEVEDLSSYYGKSNGTIWIIYSQGLIINTRNNRVLSRKKISFLIRRMTINIPYESTIVWARANNVRLLNRTRLISSSYNVTAPNGTGNPSVGSQCYILPNAVNHVSNYYSEVSYNNIFAMNAKEMQGVADYIVNNSSDFPSSSPSSPFKNKIIIINSDLTIPPFYGSGIIISKANLTIYGGTPINFSGLIYMEANKNLTIRCPGTISGIVISEPGSGILAFNNQSGSDYLIVQYDDSILNQIKKILGNYRFYSSFAK